MTLYQSSDAVTPPARRAALLLHAMPPADRVWALERLPSMQRTQLAALVQELQELGIPRDRGLVDQAVASLGGPSSTPSVPPLTPAPSPRPSARQLLESLDVEGRRELGHLLRNEPPALVARLLTVGPWPWENELLSQLGPVKRRQVEMLMTKQETGSGAATMSDVILEKIAGHLSATLQQMQRRQRPANPTSMPAGAKARWTRRLMSVFRRAGAPA